MRNMVAKTGRLMEVSASHIHFCSFGEVLLTGHDKHFPAFQAIRHFQHIVIFVSHLDDPLLCAITFRYKDFQLFPS